MKDMESNYYSFMLRTWKVKERGKLVWRASLENPTTGKRVNFHDIESMYAYLISLFENGALCEFESPPSNAKRAPLTSQIRRRLAPLLPLGKKSGREPLDY